MKNARASFMINNNILTYWRLRILSLDAFVGSLSVWILILCFFLRARNFSFEPSWLRFRALVDLSLVNKGFCGYL